MKKTLSIRGQIILAQFFILVFFFGCKKNDIVDLAAFSMNTNIENKESSIQPQSIGTIGCIPINDVIAIDIGASDEFFYFTYDGRRVFNGTTSSYIGGWYGYYELSAGYSFSDIIDVAFFGSYATYDYNVSWYKDGTYASSIYSNIWGNVNDHMPYILPAGKTPLDIVGISVTNSLGMECIAFYNDGTYSIGNRSDLGAYSGLQSYSIPAGESYSNIKAIGFRPYDGKFYAWYSDSKMSAGTPEDLGNYISLMDIICAASPVEPVVGIDIGSDDGVYFWKTNGAVTKGVSTNPNGVSNLYTLPYGKNYNDVIDMGISNSGKGYTWYKDGTMSVGYGLYNFGDFISPKPFTVPYGKNPDDIVGITIQKSNDHIFAFYDDGTFSEGNSTDLGAYVGLQNYAISSAESYTNILDIGTATSSGRFYVWFSDNKMSVGTAYDLNSFIPLKPMD